MKALIPVSNDSLEPFKEIENEAFYFGTILKDVFKGENQKLFNRRAYDICYFKSLEELNKLKELKEKNNEIKYVVNHSYPRRFKEKIKKEVELVLNENFVDYLIIEDLDLLEIAEKFGVKVFLSTRNAVINKEEAKFYYKIVGKSLAGFVMPRQAKVREINEINNFALKKGLKIEVFFEQGGCLNEERFCFFHEALDFKKNIELKKVSLPICINIFLSSKNVNKEVRSGFPGKDFFTCRSCLFAYIDNLSNVYAKIVGRCFKNSRNKKIYDYLKIVRENLRLKDKEKIIIKNRIALLKVFKKICDKDKCSTFSLI